MRIRKQNYGIKFHRQNDHQKSGAETMLLLTLSWQSVFDAHLHTVTRHEQPCTPSRCLQRALTSALHPRLNPLTSWLTTHKGQGLLTGGSGSSSLRLYGTKWTVESVRTPALEKPPSGRVAPWQGGLAVHTHNAVMMLMVGFIKQLDVSCVLSFKEAPGWTKLTDRLPSS